MKTDRVWPVGIVAVMVVFMAGMLGVVTVAIRHRPQLVSESYYADGANLRAFKEKLTASAATGWKISAQRLGAEAIVELTITDAAGLPCDSLIGHAAFYRPSNKALDIEPAALHQTGAGRYFVKTPRPLEHGSWQAVVHLARDEQEMDTRVSFFVEQG